MPSRRTRPRRSGPILLPIAVVAACALVGGDAVTSASAARAVGTHQGAIPAGLLGAANALNAKAKRAPGSPRGLATRQLGAVTAADLSGTASGPNFFTNTFVGSSASGIMPSYAAAPKHRPGPSGSALVTTLERGTPLTNPLRKQLKKSPALSVVIEETPTADYPGPSASGVYLAKVLHRATSRDGFASAGGSVAMFPRDMSHEDLLTWLGEALPTGTVRDAAAGVWRIRAPHPVTKKPIEADAVVDGRGVVVEVSPVYTPGDVPSVVPPGLLDLVRPLATPTLGPHTRAAHLRTASPLDAVVRILHGAPSTDPSMGSTPLALPLFAGEGAASDVQFSRQGNAPKNTSSKNLWLQRRHEWSNGVEEWLGYQRTETGAWASTDRPPVTHTFPQQWTKRRVFAAIAEAADAPSHELPGVEEGTRYTWKYVGGVWVRAVWFEGVVVNVDLTDPSLYAHLRHPERFDPRTSVEEPIESDESGVGSGSDSDAEA